jgi:transposase
MLELVADRARQAGHKQADEAARAKLVARYQWLLADGKRANPPPRSRREGPGRQRQRRSPAARLLARLDAHRDEVLRFLDDLRVPFTNNQAERDLRMVKLQQKISGCWRTLTGAEGSWLCAGYLSTACKQGLNPLDVLCRLFQGNPWLPAPAGS